MERDIMIKEEFDKLIGILDDRINFHESILELYEGNEKMFQPDTLMVRGKIAEDKLIIEKIFELTTNQ
jgi:hypothetical protein